VVSWGLFGDDGLETRVQAKDISCSHPVLGGHEPLIPADKISEQILFDPDMSLVKNPKLRGSVIQAFRCFCSANRNMLNGCSLNISTMDGIVVTAPCRRGRTKVEYVYNSSTTSGFTGVCFAAGVQISTPTGEKNIEDLKVGQPVLAFDHTKNAVIIAKVTKTFKHPGKPYGELLMSNNAKLSVTAEHPFYSVEKKKYVEAEKLETGETLRLIDGTTVTVTSYRPNTGTADVFNIQVDGLKNYFAGKVLVHNKF
jgi:hypothetical protein